MSLEYKVKYSESGWLRYSCFLFCTYLEVGYFHILLQAFFAYHLRITSWVINSILFFVLDK